MELLLELKLVCFNHSHNIKTTKFIFFTYYFFRLNCPMYMIGEVPAFTVAL